MKIRTWDKVKVISWNKNDKGKKTEVLKVFIKEEKVLLKDVNVATKHIKKQWTKPWQILKVEKPVHVSTVMLICPFVNKPTRLGFVEIEEKGVIKKFRYSKKALKEKGWEPAKFIIK